jgi:hypothetical protein
MTRLKTAGSSTKWAKTSHATWMVALLLATATAWAGSPDAVDAGWILSKLARPAPMHTSFVEVRGSALLKAPLRIEGEYQRPDADTLVREVRAPYVETTTIRAGEVAIARGNKSPRKFSLSRAPELQGLQASFGALLAGDRALLERYYRIDATGTRQQWTLTLAPKDTALAAKVRDITLHGRGAELRCIETRPVKGDLQRTLLAGAARAAAPNADGTTLARLCRGG